MRIETSEAKEVPIELKTFIRDNLDKLNSGYILGCIENSWPFKVYNVDGQLVLTDFKLILADGIKNSGFFKDTSIDELADFLTARFGGCDNPNRIKMKNQFVIFEDNSDFIEWALKKVVRYEH